MTAVGLLPIAAAGLDIDAMMKGANDAREAFQNPDLKIMIVIDMLLLEQFYIEKEKM